MINIHNWAKKYKLAGGSAISDLKEVKTLLNNLNINVAVEIGTAYGISTAFLAQYANKIYTFDVKTYPCRQLIWDSLKVSDKIQYNLVKNTPDTIEKLKDINFDFVFIDGRHELESIIRDYNAMKRCGRVLFHDVDKERYPENYEFLIEIGGKVVYNNLGYWEAK